MVEVLEEADAGRDMSFASLWLLQRVVISMDHDCGLQRHVSTHVWSSSLQQSQVRRAAGRRPPASQRWMKEVLGGECR